MSRLVVIGGSDAGIMAALRSRELDPSAEVTVVLADEYPNFSICGLPFYLSGEVADWRTLAHRTREDLVGQGIRLLTRHTASAIDPKSKAVVLSDPSGREIVLPYDSLILATGAKSRRPAYVKGLNLPGLFFLRWMEDGFSLENYVKENAPRSALIVGGGYIGMEMADALTRRGLAVTVVGRSRTVHKSVDAELGRMIESELERHGVAVANGVAVSEITSRGGKLIALGADGFRAEADLVLMATGAEPATELAVTAGIALGRNGAIQVSRRMETSVPDIFAAGDCVETWHRLLWKPLYLPLGTAAHKQGRVAGENAVGGNREYAGSLGTQVVKIFDLAVARTGLRDSEAEAERFSPLTVQTEGWDHKVYYPGAERLFIRVTGDHETGRLLGAQILGHWRSEVAKRIDIFATAIHHGMNVSELVDLDLSYTPPLGSPWDPVQSSVFAWERDQESTRALK
jgi:NADPH-dependent 2,4-dienoyl-CoA reductase/sulfur reductase-like enzyme